MRKLNDVNTTNIAAAIELGCRTMGQVFNADDNDIPFFRSLVYPESELSFSAAHSESHVPGRHLNALLNAEAALGISLDEDVIERHMRAAEFAYRGPAVLPFNRNEVNGPLANFRPHNVREGFHALYAMVKYRQDRRAQALAEASIDAIHEYWNAKDGWDYARLEGDYGIAVQRSTFIVGLARAIGPLVKYYRATGYTPALELALILKEKTLDGFFPEDGAYDMERLGTHTHSTTCVMSSLAQLADLTSDSVLMQRVKVFYDNGLWAIRDALGWCIENASSNADPDRGEANNTGDILETALILGRWGYTECFQDAERILRGHLLPSQLRDTSFITDPPNPDQIDGKRNVADRHLGAFGFPAPYGHAPLDAPSISFNMDIVGGAVASLCEAYRAITHTDQAGHWVNLFFDHETPAIKVESPYTHDALRIKVKLPGALFVRRPTWVTPAQIMINGVSTHQNLQNGNIFIANPPVNRFITINFPLPTETLVLKHRTREIRARLKGDSTIAMDNFGADFTFFDPY